MSLCSLSRPLTALLGLAVMLTSCDDPPSDETVPCIEPLPDCDNPTVPPTFDQLYEHVFQSCGASGTAGACHSAEGHKNGLVMSDRETAYDHLLGIGESDRRARVLPDDPWCSELLKRVESEDSEYWMPPGSSRLSDGYRCSIRQWLLAGAPRD